MPPPGADRCARSLGTGTSFCNLALPLQKGIAWSSPSKAMEKSQSPVQVEELPELQLPRAEHVRPPTRRFRRTLRCREFRGESWPSQPSSWCLQSFSGCAILTELQTASTSPAKSAQPTVAPSAPASVSAPAPAATHSKSKISGRQRDAAAHSSTPNPQPPQDAQSRKAVPPSRAVSETSTAGSVDSTAANDVTTRTFKKPTSTSSLKVRCSPESRDPRPGNFLDLSPGGRSNRQPGNTDRAGACVDPCHAEKS